MIASGQWGGHLQQQAMACSERHGHEADLVHNLQERNVCVRHHLWDAHSGDRCHPEATQDHPLYWDLPAGVHRRPVELQRGLWWRPHQVARCNVWCTEVCLDIQDDGCWVIITIDWALTDTLTLFCILDKVKSLLEYTIHNYCHSTVIYTCTSIHTAGSVQ